MGSANFLLSFIKSQEPNALFFIVRIISRPAFGGSNELVNAQVNHLQAHLSDLKFSTLLMKS